jgi:hypothetical protein
MNGNTLTARCADLTQWPTHEGMEAIHADARACEASLKAAEGAGEGERVGHACHALASAADASQRERALRALKAATRPRYTGIVRLTAAITADVDNRAALEGWADYVFNACRPLVAHVGVR